MIPVAQEDLTSNNCEPSKSILDKVKQETKLLHQGMHQHPLMLNLLSHTSSLELYQCLLCAYYDLYRRIEAQLVASIQRLNIEFDYASRTKLPWLEQDLIFFGINPTRTPTLDLALSNINDLSEFIAILYVIEGSTQGGQVLAKQLQSRLGIGPESGGRFFSAYGESTAPMWENFKQFVENSAESCDEATTIVMAKTTFLHFQQTLDHYYYAQQSLVNTD